MKAIQRDARAIAHYDLKAGCPMQSISNTVGHCIETSRDHKITRSRKAFTSQCDAYLMVPPPQPDVYVDRSTSFPQLIHPTKREI